jgi:hypothetical protein
MLPQHHLGGPKLRYVKSKKLSHKRKISHKKIADPSQKPNQLVTAKKSEPHPCAVGTV